MKPSTVTDTAPPGASEERRRAMLGVARTMFLEQGYMRVSMSAVAAKIGGSKTTLWAYFPSKEALFLAVAHDLIEEYGGHIRSSLKGEGPLDESLRRFGVNLLATLTSPPITALMRIVAAEARTIPGLGLRFHMQGIVQGWDHVSAWLAAAAGRGLVRTDVDYRRAAQHFIGMVQSGCYQRHLMSEGEAPSAEEIAGDVDAAVSAFCRAYAA